METANNADVVFCDGGVPMTKGLRVISVTQDIGNTSIRIEVNPGEHLVWHLDGSPLPGWIKPDVRVRLALMHAED